MARKIAREKRKTAKSKRLKTLKGGKRRIALKELTYWKHCKEYTYTHVGKDICVTLVVLATSKGTKVEVTGPDGSELGPLEGGSQTKCTKISAGQTIKVHAKGNSTSD